MRRFHDIGRMFGEAATGFEPLLYTRDVDGETKWIGGNWCVGFMEAVDLSFDDWQPLFDDKPSCALLAPIVTLGTEIGWKELDAAADPETEAALEDAWACRGGDPRLLAAALAHERRGIEGSQPSPSHAQAGPQRSVSMWQWEIGRAHV